MSEEPSRLSDPEPLHNYLERLGTAFRLPGSGLEPKEPEQPPEPAPPPAKSRKWLIGLACATVLAGLVVVATRGSASPLWLPSRVYGAWGTTDPRYSDRQFWIAEDQLAFQTGATKSSLAIHPMRAVHRRKGAGDTTYLDIDYGKGEKVMTFSIAFVDTPSPSILFVTQRNMRWTPAIGGTWPVGLPRPARALDLGR